MFLFINSWEILGIVQQGKPANSDGKQKKKLVDSSMKDTTLNSKHLEWNGRYS